MKVADAPVEIVDPSIAEAPPLKRGAPCDVAGLLRKTWLRVALLFLGAFAVHLPGLQGELIWDDSYLVGENPFFRSPVFAFEVFRHYLFLDSFSGHYRPVQNLSYILDYVVWNGDLYGYHLSNVLWHGGAGVLLFFLLSKLFARWEADEQTGRRLQTGAFLVALLWVLHPVHSAAVDYISGRADSLAFAFSCAAWLAYLGARGANGRITRAAGYSSAALLLLLGLCSREIAFVWAVIFVAHLLFTRQSTTRHRLLTVVAAVMILAAYAGLRQLPGPRPEQTTEATWGGVARAGLVVRALGDYVRLSVWPARLHMERSVVERRMFQPGWANQFAFTSLSMAGMVAAAALLAGLFKKGIGQPLRIFGAVWFTGGFLPISNIVELNATSAEHWLYLPLVGLLLVVFGWVIELPRREFQIATVCGLLMACGLGARSAVRSTDWLNAQVFYERTIAAGGWSPRVAVNLAIIYGHQGRLAEARNLLEHSLASWPDYPLARGHLAVILSLQGAKAESDRLFDAAAAAAPKQNTVYPRTWTASIQIARRAASEGRDDEALRILANAREMEPKVWQLAQMQSEVVRRTQGPEAALPIIQEFADANWWQYSAFLALGKLKAQQGDAEAALKALAHASRLDIRETEALNLMTRIELRAQNLRGALASQKRAVSRQPDQPSQHRLYSEVLMQMGRTEQAHEAVETAKALEEQGRGST